MILGFEKLHLKIVFSSLPLCMCVWWSNDGLSVILFFISPARTKSTSRAVTLNLRVVRLFGIHDYIIFIKNNWRFSLWYNTIANIVESWVIVVFIFYQSFIGWWIAWSRQSFHFLLLVSGDLRRETRFFLELLNLCLILVIFGIIVWKCLVCVEKRTHLFLDDPVVSFLNHIDWIHVVDWLVLIIKGYLFGWKLFTLNCWILNVSHGQLLYKWSHRRLYTTNILCLCVELLLRRVALLIIL